MHSLEAFTILHTQKNIVTSEQRISIFKNLAFTKSISIEQCPLVIWKKSSEDFLSDSRSKSICRSISKYRIFTRARAYAIQLEREDMLANLKAFEASKRGNLQKKAFLLHQRVKTMPFLSILI